MKKITKRTRFSRLINVLVTVVACAVYASAAQADTITVVVTFEDAGPGTVFQFTNYNLNNGNCPSNEEKPCLQLISGSSDNGLDTTTVTRVDGGDFTLESFWVNFLGNNGILEIAADMLIPENFSGAREEFVATLGTEFLLPVMVSSVTFTNIGESNIRIDNLTLSYEGPGEPPCTVDCDPEPCTVDCDPEPCTVDCDPEPCTVDCDPQPCTGPDCNGGPHPVPEPGTLALLGLGLAGLGAARRRKKA